MARALRILLVDDEPLVHVGVREVLRTHRHLSLCGVARDGQTAIRKARHLRPDLVLIETSLPREQGIRLIPVLRQSCPKARIVIQSRDLSIHHVKIALAHGAVGYITKGSDPRSLPDILRRIADGQVFLSPTIQQLIIDDCRRGRPTDHPIKILSAREMQILELITQGLSSKEMAAQFGVSPRTIDSHRRSIMKRLGMHSIADLVRYALSEGIDTSCAHRVR